MSKRKLSKETLQRDNYTCVHCGSRKDLTADHIKPLILGGEDRLDNLQTLCIPCHRKKDRNLATISTLMHATREAINNPPVGSYAYELKHKNSPT